VADQETWICHAFFGMLGSCNDINVLQRSPLFAKLANGEAPPMEFQANNHTYKIDYYLADGIYPRWASFMKPIVAPTGMKEVQFHNCDDLKFDNKFEVPVMYSTAIPGSMLRYT
jgi:hypothetical protein